MTTDVHPVPPRFRSTLFALALAALAAPDLPAQLSIASPSPSPDLALTIDGTFTNGVVTVETATSILGPWLPAKNVFTTSSVAVAALPNPNPDSSSFYRALAVDLTPSANGFTNLIQSYSILSTIAGRGWNDEDEVNFWQPSFEGQPATDIQLSRPHIAMADLAGNVYIADKWSHSILKILPDGTLVTAAGNHQRGNAPDTNTVATQTTLDQPNGLWVRPDGTLYIYDTGNSKIRRVDTNGIMSTLFPYNAYTLVGRGLWVSPDESLAYFCDGNTVRKWTADDGVTDLASGFYSLGNLAIDHNGQLVVTDRSDRSREVGHHVYRILQDGTKVIIAGNGTTTGGGDGQPALNTGLNEVRGVCFLPTGGYFLATHRASQIWYVDTAGIIHLFLNGFRNGARSGDGTYFYAPFEFRVSEVRQITVDHQGNLLICENDAGFIRKVQFLRHTE